MFPDSISLKTHEPDRCDLSVPTLKDGGGVRSIAPRSKGADRPTIVCPITNRVLNFESGIEGNTGLHLYGDPRITRVFVQFARIWYEDEQKNRHPHVLDVGAIRDDGYRYGILCKPLTKAITSNLKEFCEVLARSTPTAVANELLIATDRDFPDFELSNSALFLSVRTDCRVYADDLLVEIAPTLVAARPISELTAILGGGRIGFRAVARAIFYGTLICVNRGAILPTTLIRFSGAIGIDLDRNGPTATVGLKSLAPAEPPKRPKRLPARS